MNKHEERKHALLSASGASRWLNCTPSPRLEEQFKEETSIYAQEGTLAHEFADIILRHWLELTEDGEADAAVEAMKNHELYSAEMDTHVDTYVNYVLEALNVARQTEEDAVLLVEQRIDLTHWIEDGFGTGDAAVIGGTMLEAIDLKYGKAEVLANNNPQLMLYGLGSLRACELSYDIETVKLTIVQPRLHSISSWEISAEDLRVWGKQVVRPTAKIAFSGEGEQCAGSWCKWCRAKAKCRALADESLALAKLEFQDPKLLSDSELIEAYSQIELLTVWAGAVQEYALEEAKGGKDWEGYKLVRGISRRVWTDTNDVIDALTIEGFQEDKIQESKLKGLGKIEALMSKDKFKELLGHLIFKPPGKLKLVPNSARGKAYIVSSAKEDFK